jgi:hypothetical protein
MSILGAFILNPLKNKTMKTIQFTPKEFYLFQQLANQMDILFMYYVSNGLVNVEANAVELEGLGY